MAFSSSEKSQIRRYLGYSGGFRDLNYHLESMMDLLGADVDEAAYVRTLLTEIAAVDTAINTAGVGGAAATYGAVKKVDELEFHPLTIGQTGTSTLTGVSYGEVLINRLSLELGIGIEGYYFRRKAAINFGPFGPTGK